MNKKSDFHSIFPFAANSTVDSASNDGSFPIGSRPEGLTAGPSNNYTFAVDSSRNNVQNTNKFPVNYGPFINNEATLESHSKKPSRDNSGKSLGIDEKPLIDAIDAGSLQKSTNHHSESAQSSINPALTWKFNKLNALLSSLNPAGKIIQKDRLNKDLSTQILVGTLLKNPGIKLLPIHIHPSAATHSNQPAKYPSPNDPKIDTVNRSPNQDTILPSINNILNTNERRSSVPQDIQTPKSRPSYIPTQQWEVGDFKLIHILKATWIVEFFSWHGKEYLNFGEFNFSIDEFINILFNLGEEYQICIKMYHCLLLSHQQFKFDSKNPLNVLFGLSKCLAMLNEELGNKFKTEFYSIHPADHIDALWELVSAQGVDINREISYRTGKLNLLNSERKKLDGEMLQIKEKLTEIAKAIDGQSVEDSRAETWPANSPKKISSSYQGNEYVAAVPKMMENINDKKQEIETEYLKLHTELKHLKEFRSSSWLLGSDRYGAGYWMIQPFRKLDNQGKLNSTGGIIVETALYLERYQSSYLLIQDHKQLEEIFSNCREVDENEKKLLDRLKKIGHISWDSTKLQEFIRKTLGRKLMMPAKTAFDKNFGAPVIEKIQYIGALCDLDDEKILELSDFVGESAKTIAATLIQWINSEDLKGMPNSKKEELESVNSFGSLHHWCSRATENAKSIYRADRIKKQFTANREKRNSPGKSPLIVADDTNSDGSVSIDSTSENADDELEASDFYINSKSAQNEMGENGSSIKRNSSFLEQSPPDKDELLATPVGKDDLLYSPSPKSSLGNIFGQEGFDTKKNLKRKTIFSESDSENNEKETDNAELSPSSIRETEIIDSSELVGPVANTVRPRTGKNSTIIIDSDSGSASETPLIRLADVGSTKQSNYKVKINKFTIDSDSN